uniref:R3H domain containing 1 n=1 Tax=Petromyzon marinus TaxID=7757 RepID=S4RRU5_PETMA
QRRPQNQGATRKRTKSNAKMKLVRSLAVCDDPSPPPAADAGVQDNQEPHSGGREEESVLRDKDRGSERATAERQEKMPKVPRILSRDSSQDYTDSTGVDVHEFLVNTLKNNPRDRMMLLKMEQELMEFVQDNKLNIKHFPDSLIHCALTKPVLVHYLKKNGSVLRLFSCQSSSLCMALLSACCIDAPPPRFAMQFKNRFYSCSVVRSSNQLAPTTQPACPTTIHVHSRGKKDSGRLTNGSGQGGSGESELRPAEPRPWSSTDLESSGFRLARPAITKASSFGGISVLARGDSCSGGGKSNAGRLSKTVMILPPSPPFYCHQLVSPMGGHMVAPPPSQQPPQQQAHSSVNPVFALDPNVPSYQPGQYSVVSYPPPAAAPTHLPTSPQSLMPVLSAQQSYPVPEELGPHFSQLSLGQPTAGDASEPSHAHVYHAIVPQNSAQPPTYLGQHLQPGGFPPPAAAANSATQQHQQQQQQAYGQSQPHGQVQVHSSPPAQYQPSSQQYRAVAPVQYGTPRGQQPVNRSLSLATPPPLPSQTPTTTSSKMGCRNPPHSQGLMGGQQGTVGSPAQGPMGNTMQGVMVQYTPMTSYHMPQSGPQAPPPPAPPPQQSYQPPVLMGGGQQLYCNVGPPPPPPPPPSSMSGSGVSYLHPPGMEQLQFRTPSPAGSQPTQGQHYATGLSPSGHGVFVMQLSLPSSPHPPRTAASPTRWGQRRGLSLDQRLPRTSEHGGTEGINQQASPRLSSPMASPVQSPNSSPLAALSSIRPGLLPLPLVQSRPIAPKQGDGRYPLAGPAVQYGPQTCGLQPPHPHMTVSLQQVGDGVKTGGRGKRHPRKALSEDTSSVEQASATLEVLDLPHGISRVEADALLGKLAAAGGEIHWLQDARMEQGQAAAASSLAGCNAALRQDLASHYKVVAVFPTRQLAQAALAKLGHGTGSGFRLRPFRRRYEAHTLERASSH